jgi:hypothetical protein
MTLAKIIILVSLSCFPRDCISTRDTGLPENATALSIYVYLGSRINTKKWTLMSCTTAVHYTICNIPSTDMALLILQFSTALAK